MRRLLFAVVPFALGCATASPRFSQEVATTFAQDDMRRLETDSLEVYYPAAHKAAAERIARRATECLERYRQLQRRERPRARALLFLTSANFNNAYVTGQFVGEPLHSVNPLQTSLELLHWYGLSGAGADDVSCHEMFHYAHFEQIEAFWRYFNVVTGQTFSPQLFTERWFTEGVAQYYEGRIGRTVGRPNSPIYRGAFESFVDERGGALGPGDLSANQRELYPYSGAYLTSLPFVEWLVKRSGEETLWELMDKQGAAFFAPLAVTLRFGDVYGKSLGDLVTEWSNELARTLPKRTRPASQIVLRDRLGQLARVAVHGPTGTIALVSSGNDEPPMLRILSREGAVLAEQSLVQLHPGRERVLVGPSVMSGLSFSADGQWLYLMNEDLVSRGDTMTQLWKIEVATGATVKIWQAIARGQGGAITPSGTAYVFVDFSAGRSRLASFDLETEVITSLYEPAAGVAISAPSISPDGARITFSQLDGNGWNLWLREASGEVRALTNDGAFNYGAKWIDGNHLTLPRTHQGRLQVHRLTVDSTRLERLTDAPFTLLDAWPSGAEVVFVNRAGTQWSLDRAPSTVLEVVQEGVLTAQTEPAADAQATDAPPPAPPVLTVPPPFPDSPPLTVTSDEPYSGLDHLFFPQLRIPGVTVLPETTSTAVTGWTTTFYASLAGKDRLSRHNWALNASLAFPNAASPFRFDVTPRWSASVEYVNQQLAPWTLGAYGSRDPILGGAFWTASLSGGRTFFTVPVNVALRGLVSESFIGNVNGYFLRCPTATPCSFLEKYFGPEVSASFSATESTAYGGARKHFSISGTARAYSAMVGSDRSMVDLSAHVGFAVPLPFTRRHTLVGSVNGRWLPGAPSSALLVGGQPAGFNVFQSPMSADAPSGPRAYLPGSLAEAVRGYDDYAVRTEGAAIAHARYRFVFPIDRGTASILWLFPSFFARQFDVEAFGSAAVTLQGQWLRATGGAVNFRFMLMDVVPVTLNYQFAWRFDFDRGALHTVSLSVE